MLCPILHQLKVAEHVDDHCPGKEEVSHGTVIDTLVLNRLMAQKPMHKVGEWVIETVLEDTLRVSAGQIYDNRQGRTLLIFAAMIA